MDLFDPVDRAMYDTVHEFVDRGGKRRGAVALAPKVGMQPGTLSNKVNPLMDTHQLGVRESLPLQLATKDFRILQACAQVLGHCVYALPDDCENTSDVELLSQYAEFHATVGLHSTSIRDALKDGRIQSSEVAAVRQAFDSLVRSGLCVLLRLEALTDVSA
jgi:hypothetical protein